LRLCNAPSTSSRPRASVVALSTLGIDGSAKLEKEGRKTSAFT
jgi:hypothetical protein